LVKVYLFVFHVYKYNSCVSLMQLFYLTFVFRSPYICCVLTLQCLTAVQCGKMRNLILSSKCPRTVRRGLFFSPTPPPESAPSVQEANFIREYVGSGSCPFVGRGILFFTGEAFSFLLFRFLLDLFLFSVFSFKTIQFLVAHLDPECRYQASQQQTA
jgi:hypothetical protein